MQELKRLLGGESGIPLDLAAAQIAELIEPGVEAARVVAGIDDLAGKLAESLPEPAAHLSGREFITYANRFFFEELGFRGDEANYYDPRNSLLHQVLKRRTGMPITLSVVYMEVARRLDRNVRGIGLPGHFLVQYADPKWSTYIDPFHQGRLLSRVECVELIHQRTGIELTAAQQNLFFQPASNRDIVLRILRNLEGMCIRSRDFAKGLAVAELLQSSAGETTGQPEFDPSTEQRRRRKAPWN